jgi:hypothetical protein
MIELLEWLSNGASASLEQTSDSFLPLFPTPGTQT